MVLVLGTSRPVGNREPCRDWSQAVTELAQRDTCSGCVLSPFHGPSSSISCSHPVLVACNQWLDMFRSMVLALNYFAPSKLEHRRRGVPCTNTTHDSAYNRTYKEHAGLEKGVDNVHLQGDVLISKILVIAMGYRCASHPASHTVDQVSSP
jgi:hypothetical protein